MEDASLGNSEQSILPSFSQRRTERSIFPFVAVKVYRKEKVLWEKAETKLHAVDSVFGSDS